MLSHLHHDHGDGLPDLDGIPIYLSQEHWDAFCHDIPSGPAIGPFTRSYPLTTDGKVVAVDTPGHVPGHLSVIVFTDTVAYFLGGDSTYDQQLLDAEVTDGVNKNPKLAIESVRKIKEFARQHPTVILPAHDPHAATRLANNQTFTPT